MKQEQVEKMHEKMSIPKVGMIVKIDGRLGIICGGTVSNETHELRKMNVRFFDEGPDVLSHEIDISHYMVMPRELDPKYEGVRISDRVPSDLIDMAEGITETPSVQKMFRSAKAPNMLPQEFVRQFYFGELESGTTQ